MAVDQNTKIYFANAKDKANEVLSQPHIGADVKSLVKDLIVIAENFRESNEQQTNFTADIRVLRKRLEAMRANNKNATAKMQELRKSILTMASDIEFISVEASKITKRHTPDDPDGGSGQRIQESAKKVITVVMQLTSNLPTFSDDP